MGNALGVPDRGGSNGPSGEQKLGRGPPGVLRSAGLRCYDDAMRHLLLSLVLLGSCESPSPKAPEPRPGELLIFTRTAGYRHPSVDPGSICVAELGRELGLESTRTEDPADFNDETLNRFACVVFLNTTNDVLEANGEAAFERYIQAGGGFLGIHAATDTEYDWPWYTGLVGAQFVNHPKIQSAKLTRLDGEFPATEFLPETWERTDEWYNFKAISKDIHVLLNLEESSYEGGTNGEEHPAAWYHEYDGGRAFYTAGGHTNESYSEPLFRRNLLEGLRWAANLPAQ